MNLKEKIALLKNELERLDNELKKIELAWFQSIDSFEIAKNNLDSPITSEGLKVVASQYREVMAKQIELFRANSDMIRRVTPTAAEFLDKKILELEKNDREFQRKNFEKEVSQDEIKPLLDEYQKLYDEIDTNIELFRKIIQDTIKKFES